MAGPLHQSKAQSSTVNDALPQTMPQSWKHPKKRQLRTVAGTLPNLRLAVVKTKPSTTTDSPGAASPDASRALTP